MTSKEPLKMVVREAPSPKPRRVYKAVSVGEDAGIFRVLLDGKPVRTPLRHIVAMPNRAMADAVAAEWDAQDPFVDPVTMPLTRLVATALDRVTPARDALITELMNYAEADLLCYHAGHPADLKARQRAVWQPVLDWLDASFGIGFTVGVGLMPHSQSAASIAALEAALTALEDGPLTALQACAAITNSLALSLALVHGRLTAVEVCAAALLDECYQMETWGEDKLALDRHQNIEAELLAIGAYVRLLKG